MTGGFQTCRVTKLDVCNVFIGKAQSPVSRTADQYFSNAQHSLQKMHIMDYDWAQDSIVVL